VCCGWPGRTKDDIETIRHLYLDIDHNGPLALETVEHSALVPRPNYVLETSPEKYQVVWKVEGISQDEAEAHHRAMVREGELALAPGTRDQDSCHFHTDYAGHWRVNKRIIY
jgi:hypothetical protein